MLFFFFFEECIFHFNEMEKCVCVRRACSQGHKDLSIHPWANVKTVKWKLKAPNANVSGAANWAWEENHFWGDNMMNVQ